MSRTCSPITGGIGTILVADDEPLVRDMISRLLKGQGYTVLEASDGLQALQVVQECDKDEIDLLLTDVAMPQMDGIQLVAEFRQLFPSAKIILMSGYTDESKLQHVITGPDVEFLEKPFHVQVLLQKMRDMLGHPV